MIEDVIRDVRYTCRSLRRAPLVALTIVTTVGLGLGLVAAVLTILNMYVFTPPACCASSSPARARP